MHLVHMKQVVTDDIVVEMGGEAANGQYSDDEMEIHCEEEEMAVGALVLKCMQTFIYSYQ